MQEVAERAGGLSVRCQGLVHLYKTFEGHDVVALQGVDLDRRGRGARRLPRAQRLGQVDPADPLRRHPAAQRRPDLPRRRGDLADERAPADPGPRLPGQHDAPGRDPQPAPLRHRPPEPPLQPLRQQRPRPHARRRRAAAPRRPRGAGRPGRVVDVGRRAAAAGARVQRHQRARSSCSPTSRPASSATRTATTCSS